MIKNIFYSLLVTTSFFVVMNFANAGVSGTTVYVDSAAVGTGDGSSLVDAFNTIDDALNATTTVSGDTLEIYGNFVTTNNLVINKSVTLHGNTGASISTSGTNQLFTITSPDVIIKNLNFTKTDKNGVQNLIGIQANNTEIANNVFLGQYVIGDGDVSRAMVVSPGVSGYNIHDNSITNFRQPAYIDASTGSVTNNYVTGTKGWVILSDSNTTLTGNTFGTNVFDFAFIPGPSNNYSDIVAISNANGNAIIENQFGGTPVLNVVYVDASVSLTGNGTQASPYKTITEALTRVTTGGTIRVAAGSYTENLTVNKALTLLGANSGIDAVSGTRGAESVVTGRILVTASDVKVDGLKITNPTYSTASSIHGIQVFGNGPTISNVVLSNNIISEINNSTTKGAYGIMVQADVSGVTIEKNKIDTITSAGWARGIEITPSCGVVGIPQAVTISKNSVTNIIDTAGDDSYVVSVDWCSSVPRIADASQITLDKNIFDSTKVKNLDTVHSLLIAKNWFGAVTPDFSSATGSVIFSPWCLVDSCVSIWSQPGSGPSPSPASGGSGSVSTTTATSTATTTATSTTILQQTSTTTEQVLGASTFNFTRNLSFGMRGNDVSELQKILIAKGYLKLKTGQPTGWFGPLTRAALIKWQLENKIRAEGYFGPISRNILNPKN